MRGLGKTKDGMPVRRRASRRLLSGSAGIASLLIATGAPAQSVDVVASAGSATKVAQAAGSQTAVVTTTKVTSGTGFNRFDHFNVANGQAATLVVPTGANNLVNIVRDESTINGAVTSRLGNQNGLVGGNTFFVVPSGLVIGATGVINTGRLIVRGNPKDTASGADPTLQQVIDGGAADHLVIDGRISAPGGVDLRGRTVSVGAGGAVETGAAALARIGTAAVSQPSLVSTQGLPAGTAIVTTASGGIAIVADSSVTVAGAVADNPATAANETLPGGVLDARPTMFTAGSNVTPAPGGITIGAPTIALAGTVTAWDGNAGSKAGDITLLASDSETYGGLFGLSQPFLGMPSASTGITLVAPVPIGTGGKGAILAAGGNLAISTTTDPRATLQVKTALMALPAVATFKMPAPATLGVRRATAITQGTTGRHPDGQVGANARGHSHTGQRGQVHQVC